MIFAFLQRSETKPTISPRYTCISDEEGLVLGLSAISYDEIIECLGIVKVSV